MQSICLPCLHLDNVYMPLNVGKANEEILCSFRLYLCEKALAEYLDTKRLAFPRFYFLSSSDLLDILSNGTAPQQVSRGVLVETARKTEELQQESFRFPVMPPLSGSVFQTCAAISSIPNLSSTLLPPLLILWMPPAPSPSVAVTP